MSDSLGPYQHEHFDQIDYRSVPCAFPGCFMGTPRPEWHEAVIPRFTPRQIAAGIAFHRLETRRYVRKHEVYPATTLRPDGYHVFLWQLT